ncbi:beta-galactosidase trimerization domain-containing protein [Dictyobacter kobayashii]|uniref:Beta-galactosidase n=1 Tax=Dictyobacter kobayashii TaxID=2014872 RepID=A0A402ASI8_9CHLR|nr:beta-galactosidase trimerization domain-containing protein [Dictyobacter kobayashii]GCE22088.1 hypothetical protein KDK_58880 [Dictyobacter kobayashii]
MQKECFWSQQPPAFSVGFNYHPSATGCQYWQQWIPGDIEHDLQEMARRGFNTVRFFLFWADFEPVAGCYDERVIQRLQEFVQMARRCGLWCVPSLLTIWMNGQLFDLPWRQGRDLWTDPTMVQFEVDYVQRIASALRDADNILAYDLGDEIIHVDFHSAQQLSRDEVKTWQQTLATAIRQIQPSAQIVQGNEASSIFGMHEFRPENSQALDRLAIHGFPLWTPFAIESVMSYKATLFVPFLIQMARQHGPILIDELGSYGTDDEVATHFLRATTHSCLANGARGIIVWCWQDFLSTNKPFNKHPNERFVGLLNTDGTPKPMLPTFEEFARLATTQWSTLTLPAPSVGIYLPHREEESGPNYIQPRTSSASAAFYSFLLLKRTHTQFEFVHGPLERYSIIFCPSVEHMTLAEHKQLAAYVQQGGTLYYSCGDYLHGFGGEELFGIQLHDFTLQASDMSHFNWLGQDYTLDWSDKNAAYPQIPIIKATTATVLATFPNNTPALTCQTYGRGRAYYLNAPFERQLDTPMRLQAQPWHTLYAELLQRAGVRDDVQIDHPDVELILLQGDQQRYAFLINHAATQVQVTLTIHVDAQAKSTQTQFTLDPKAVHIIHWSQTPSTNVALTHQAMTI